MSSGGVIGSWRWVATHHGSLSKDKASIPLTAKKRGVYHFVSRTQEQHIEGVEGKRQGYSRFSRH